MILTKKKYSDGSSKEIRFYLKKTREGYTWTKNNRFATIFEYEHEAAKMGRKVFSREGIYPLIFH